jgi:hypothetical protein
MRELISNYFLAGTAFYLLSAVLAVISMTKTRNIFFVMGTAAVLASAALRIYYNLPLICLFQEPYIIVFFAGFITIYLYLFKRDSGLCVYAGGATVVLSLYTLIFPGDIYMSFAKTNSLFAHGYSLFSSLARALYLCTGAMALRGIVRTVSREQRVSDNEITGNLIIAGYCIHSLGMFSGGLWSYVGWGTPVQWQSHIFLGMAGVWFYYSWHLHLKLSLGPGKARLSYSTLGGGIVTFIFSFLPETGKLSIPWIVR